MFGIGGDRNSAGTPESIQPSLSTKLTTQLEEWLKPNVLGEDGMNIGETLKSLIGIVGEETKMSADEKRRHPVNLLVLRAMHDRERMAAAAAQEAMENGNTAKSNPRETLESEDRGILTRAARFAGFAAAAYTVSESVATLKRLVAKQNSTPPSPELMKDTDHLKKLYLSRHTNIAIDDVKYIVTTGSLAERAYVVAMDHSTRSVVLSIRGTQSVHDALVDLVCRPTDFAGGKAHDGISRNALKVWSGAKELVEALLGEYDDYKLVLTGHSLGAGTAILLKIFFSSEADEVVEADVVEGRETMENKERSLEGLNAGRPVHVECFAFAPPPVFFGEGGSADTPDMYSFINACDCVPTISLGAMYSLFRTVRRIDQLPLDVSQRARFVLDSEVRLQNGGLAPDIDKREEPQADLGNDGSENGGGKEDGHGNSSPGVATDHRPPSFAKDGANVVARFRREIKQAADKLHGEVGQVASRTSPKTILLKKLEERAGGGKGEGGPDPDEMMVMIQRCEQDGRRAERSSLGYDITTGDLIVPGRVYHLQDDVTFGTTTGSGGGGGVGVDDGGDVAAAGWMGTVRRTSSDVFSRGIRLSATMLTDHFMDKYEPKLREAARRYA